MMSACACTDCQGGGGGKDNSTREGQKVQDMQLGFDTVKNKTVHLEGGNGVVAVDISKFFCV